MFLGWSFWRSFFRAPGLETCHPRDRVSEGGHEAIWIRGRFGSNALMDNGHMKELQCRAPHQLGRNEVMCEKFSQARPLQR